MTEEERKAKNAQYQREHRERMKNDPEAQERHRAYMREWRENRRKKAKGTPKAETQQKPKKPPTKAKPDLVVDSDNDDDLSSVFPYDDVIAAAVNHKHHLTEVLADGQLSSGRERVFVEKARTEIGAACFRVKRVTYSYHRSLPAALADARKGRCRLKLYGEAEKL